MKHISLTFDKAGQESLPQHIKDKMKADQERAKLDMLKKTSEILKSGYAGTLPNGNIVDRRDFPDAYPISENLLLDLP